MIGLAAICVGLLFAAAVYLMLSRDTQRIALGFLLLSNGTNLMVISAGGLPREAGPPFAGASGAPADPLPQAFVLTAIVISLGALALLLAMAMRARRELGEAPLEEQEER